MRKHQLPPEPNPTVIFHTSCSACEVGHKSTRERYNLDDVFRAFVPKQCRHLPFWLMPVTSEFPSSRNEGEVFKCVDCPLQRGVYRGQ